MNTDNRYLAIAAVLAGLLILVAIEFIDRPLARWTHEQFHGLFLFPLLTQISDTVVQIASGCLFVMMLAAVVGWRTGPIGRAALTAFIAVLVAVTIKESLKFLFGRTWPETWVNGNPSYIHDGVYGFSPLHGGKGWMSFPSGHTTVMAALISASWQSFPRLRWVGVGAGVLVVIGLIGADFHWLSDIMAGAILGTLVGSGLATLMPCKVCAENSDNR